jgi:hypothetical protein
VGFRVARVVLTQNSSQSSPLSQMKLVILQKAGHVISTLRNFNSMAARINKIVISELAATDANHS